MRRTFRFLAGLLGLLLSASITAAAEGPHVVGRTLPYQVHDLDGNVVESSDPRFRGKVVLVDLWGTWCPPCITELPTFIDLQSRYGEQGLVRIGRNPEPASLFGRRSVGTVGILVVHPEEDGIVGNGVEPAKRALCGGPGRAFEVTLAPSFGLL